MDHDIEIEKRTFADLIKLGKELNMPLLATNDLHYTHHKDSSAHEVLLCIQSGSTLADPKRFKFDNAEFYLKSAKQMRELFKDFPESCDNTLLIAERCNTTMREGENLLPQFPVPNNESEDSWLIKQANLGLAKKLDGKIPNNYQRAVGFRIRCNDKDGFSWLFLGSGRSLQSCPSSGNPRWSW